MTAGHGDAASATTSWLVPDAAALPGTALALPAVLIAQYLALHSSMARGLMADNPFLGGEVDWVVQGVRIHGFDRSR